MRRKLASRKRAIQQKPLAQTASEENVGDGLEGRCGRRASWKPWEGRQIPQEWLNTKGKGEQDRNMEDSQVSGSQPG